MNYKKEHLKCISHRMFILWMGLSLLGIVQNVCAQNEPKKTSAHKASRYSSLPSGYNQIGTTKLYCKQSSHAIDIIGYYDGYYYSSTYSDYGYKLSVKVGDNSPVRVDCLNGTTNNGVLVSSSIEQQGELARICYTLTNNNSKDIVVSLGVHADVMIGDNDRAPIERRKDTFGQTYGLTMKDGNGAQLCVLFGSGLTGVSAVSDFWFGTYLLNQGTSAMVGNYTSNNDSGSHWMEENGAYDSGMGWCWKERSITAGSMAVFSYLIGVGEVNLEPNSSFEVTPDDAEGWNDLSRPHRISVNGSYESPAGIDGFVEYAVEDSEDWTVLTDTMKSGSEFHGNLVVMFSANRPTHVIKFRTKDLVGNTTFLHPIEYTDISFHDLIGIEEKTYTGDSLYQENTTCDLATNQYILTSYQNNVNKGTASFNMEGVFPYTIGRKEYTFTIAPQTLSGGLALSQSEFVYNGSFITPTWIFTNEAYANLEEGKDYEKKWSGNQQPGEGKLIVTGKNNYTGVLTANFYIDKAQLTNRLYSLYLPKEDITFDGKSHGASITTSNGVGKATITYQKQGEVNESTESPTSPGKYTIFLEFAEGQLYHGRGKAQVGSFTIYEFNAEEWAVLQTVFPQLKEMGWSQPWDMSQGMKSVSDLHGLTIEKGHVTKLDLSNQNLTGMFPYILLAFPNLQSVNLSNNHLTGDIGTTTYAFAQQNPTMMTNIKEVNISGNQFSGNIGLFANCLAKLTSLDASNNCLEDVRPVIPPTVTTLDIGKQTIARVVSLHLANLSVDNLVMKVPSILLYDHANQTYKTDINLQCVTIDNSWGMTMAYQKGQLSIPYVSEQNIYYGENGDTLNVALLYNNGTREGSTFRIKLSFDEGDSNFDGKVNVLDLQSMLNYMFEVYENKPYNFTATNLWKDGFINVQDAVSLVNILLENNPAPASAQLYHQRREVAAISSDNDATVFVANGKLIVNAAEPVSSFDIVVATGSEYNVNEALASAGFTCRVKQTEDEVHLIGYSLNGATLPVGENVLGTLTGGVVIYSMLADTEAEEITTPFGSTPTGIHSATSGTQRLNEVYRIPLGAKRSILIDAKGKKHMVTE